MQAVKAALSRGLGQLFGGERALSSKEPRPESPKRHEKAASAAAVPPYKVALIGDAGKQAQGTSAVCHGTLLYLGEKGLGVEVAHYLQEGRADSWVQEVCPGGAQMPLLHAPEGDRWVCGPEAIWDYVELHHPGGRDLGRPVTELSDGVVLGQLAPGDAAGADRLTQLLIAVLGSSGAEGEQALNEFEALLRELDDWLAEREMPFIGGDAPNATDCYLAPRLNQAVLALGALRGWALPEDLQALHRYLVLWRERPSWRESHFDEGLAVGPWQRMAEAAQATGAKSS